MTKPTKKQPHDDLETEAGRRSVKRRILQFRADSETVKAVFATAEKHKMPVSALLRKWVQEKLVADSLKPGLPTDQTWQEFY